MKVRLGDVLELNPRESIVKNTIARKISMTDLRPFTRDIPTFSYEKYSGGAKFRNNDILLARITPCLENGKTALVNILDKDEVAFGSTEYFVLRAKKGLIDPYYLYYLSISQDFRKVIIKSMTGTSGRQRAQKDAILEYKLDLPNIQEQHSIAKQLRVLDDKIRLNKQINDNLLELTQSVYQELNSNRTTDGTLSNICQLVTKKIDTAELNNNNFWSTSNLLSNKRGATQAKEMPKSTKCTEVYRFDTLFGNIRPYFKKVYLASRNGGCSPDVLAFRAISKKLQAYLFSIIASDKFINQAVAGSKGTKMPRGDKEQMMETPIYTPTEQELSAFNKAVIPSLVAIQENTTENEYLTLIKQQLLLKYF